MVLSELTQHEIASLKIVGDGANRNATILFGVFSAGSYFILPCVIFSTMVATMYRAVMAQKKKLQQFGVGGALSAMRTRNRNAEAGIVERNAEDAVANVNKTKQKQAVVTHWFESRPGGLRQNKEISTSQRIRSNNSGKQSRAIMNSRALSYSLAFFCTYILSSLLVFGLSGWWIRGGSRSQHNCTYILPPSRILQRSSVHSFKSRARLC
jgi:hypothetical protein